MSPDTRIVVRRNPQSYEKAVYLYSDIDDLHLSHVSGGVRITTVHKHIYGSGVKSPPDAINKMENVV